MSAVMMKFQAFGDNRKPRQLMNSFRRFGGECL